jgi:hypothetical protein
MKIRRVGAELFHARRIDRHDEANSYFSHFCEKALKRVQGLQSTCNLQNISITISIFFHIKMLENLYSNFFTDTHKHARTHTHTQIFCARPGGSKARNLRQNKTTDLF